MIRSFGFLRTLLFSLFAIIAGGVWAQSEMVGVNTRNPTEKLHVNGTMRVQELIPNGQPGYYYQNYTPNTTNNFVQNQLLVADKNGVLGGSVGEIEKFFYMPPILLPLHNYAADPEEKTTDGIFRINLYNHYVKQFTLADGETSKCSPTGNNAANKIPIRPAQDLEFFVIYVTPNIFQNISVDDTGVLTYTVLPGIEPDEFTYVNIVFKMKD